MKSEWSFVSIAFEQDGPIFALDSLGRVWRQYWHKTANRSYWKVEEVLPTNEEEYIEQLPK